MSGSTYLSIHIVFCPASSGERVDHDDAKFALPFVTHIIHATQSVEVKALTLLKESSA